MSGATTVKAAEKGKWIEILVSTVPQFTEALSNFLTEAGAKGVIQEEIPEDSPNELAEQADRQDELKAYIAAGATGEKKIAALGKYIESLAELFPEEIKPVFTTRLIADSDWGEQWKKYFKPIRLAQNIVIKPTWERYTPLHPDIVIEIDPGMAFGTGQHPSTGMCLSAIEDTLLQDRTVHKWRVLDVGTGTGILAIACAKLGAETVLGVDTDPKAVEIARKNVLINEVGNRVKIMHRDVNKVTGSYDLVVANLTAETLLDLKSRLLTLTSPHSYLILSGIIEKNAAKVEEGFAAEMTVLRSLIEKEWVCYVLRKG